MLALFNNIFFNVNTYEDYLKAKNQILPEYIKNGGTKMIPIISIVGKK